MTENNSEGLFNLLCKMKVQSCVCSRVFLVLCHLLFKKKKNSSKSNYYFCLMTSSPTHDHSPRLRLPNRRAKIEAQNKLTVNLTIKPKLAHLCTCSYISRLPINVCLFGFLFYFIFWRGVEN